jgi:DNA-binding beta-propeller fold protein YncE
MVPQTLTETSSKTAGWQEAPLSAAIAVAMAILFAGCGVGGSSAGALVSVWGKRGLMPGQFTTPRAIAIDRGDRLYLVDMRAIIQVFDAEGQFQIGWETPTHEFGRPSGLAVDRDGSLLVADSHYHRILVYGPAGELRRIVGGDEEAGPLTGRFGYIGDVAVDSTGCWYVAESQQHERITKLDPNGALLAEWGGRGHRPGQFQRIRALTFDRADRLYVADACNHRVQVFDTEGHVLQIIGEAGEGIGQLHYPFDVAVCPDQSIVVCEYGNHRIQRFSPEGRSLGVWGKPGRNPGELFNPWAVGVDSQGRIYVVDSNNHRVQCVRF